MSKFKNMKLRYKIGVGVASTAAIVAAGGAAFAYFTDTGSNTGTATTGSSSHWTVAVTGDTTSLDLVPVAAIGTGPSDTESYTITNASAGSQYLKQAVISVKSVTDGSSTTATDHCVAADFSVNGQAVGTSYTQSIGTDELGTQDATGPGVYSGSVSLQLVDDNTNQDACQGATVTLEVDAS